MSALASAFERATAVEPLGDGAWSATCDPAWATQIGANGGYIGAILLRAMIAELDDPAREARSLTCHYLRPPGMGDVRVEVAVERQGRTMSTATARLTQGGRLCVGAPEAVTGGWLRFADPQPLDAPALAMYADAWLPSPMPYLTRPAAAPTIDLTVHFRAPGVAAAIADEPVLAVFRSSTAAGGLFEEDGELWSRDGVLLAQSRQLGLLLADPR
jgi:Acyl-CoA thioesterase C-terminal domain